MTRNALLLLLVAVSTACSLDQRPVPATTAPAERISIAELHGPVARSPYQGQIVTTEGIVTLVHPDGFWIQSTSDHVPEQREGLQVFTASRAPVGEGDQVRVTGYVERYRQPGRGRDRFVTRLVQPGELAVLASDRPLPPAIRIGADGLRVPANQYDEDPTIDPSQSATDFWTWLTGMRVEITDHVVIGPTSRFGETWVMSPPEHPDLNEHSVLIARPEGDHLDRIQINTHPLLRPDFPEPALPGDRFHRLDGVVDYAFGGFRVLPRHALQLDRADRSPDALSPTTVLIGGREHLTVAAYNVENLDPVIERLDRVNDFDDLSDDLGSGRMARLGGHIAVSMASPDIVALQEIQDNNGAELGEVVSADRTYTALIDAIVAAGGPRYAFIDLPPVADSEGGQPGGNIRNGYLFNPERVRLIDNSTERFIHPAFEGSRAPVLAAFEFNDHRIDLINNHFSSKGGSSPLFGEGERIVGRAEARRDQATAIRALLADRAAWAGPAHWIVLGDLNDHWFSEPLSILKSEGEERLVNLIETRPMDERWTYIFRGTGQAIDHILTTPALADRAEVEVVHVNARLADQAADHEPILARFHLPPQR
jgi:predicted extracellular nuclease